MDGVGVRGGDGDPRVVARAEERQVGELRGEAGRVEEVRGHGRDQEELEAEGGEAVEAVHPGNLLLQRMCSSFVEHPFSTSNNLRRPKPLKPRVAAIWQ